MTFDEAISKIELGNAVLFLGSGFSFGAKNISNSYILSTEGLRNSFLDMAGITSDKEQYDLKLASEEAFGSDKQAVFDAIRRSFQAAKCSEDHEYIASKRWRRVYTTNYDNVLELAASQSGYPYLSVTLSDKSAVNGGSDRCLEIVHIHGLSTKLTEDTFETEFLLTTKQYRDLKFQGSHWRKRLHDDFSYADVIFFVGFSAEDVHITEIMRSISFLSSKVYFIVGPTLSVPIKKRIESLGSIHCIGLQGFVDLIKRTAPMQIIDVRNPDCLVEKRFSLIRDDVTSTRDDVRDELLVGSLKEDFFTGTIRPKNPTGMYIDRILRRIGKIPEGKKRPIIIHGDIGNGKSVCANHLAAFISKDGSKAYLYNGRSYDNGDMIHFIKSLKDPIFIIENLTLSLGFARIIRENCASATVIATDRSKRLEIFSREIREALGEVIKIDVNKLLDEEIKDLVSYLDGNILWGEYTNLSNEFQKVKFIREKCGSELRGVLFALFEGGSVRDRIENIFSDIDNLPRVYRDIFILVCVVNFAYVKNDLSGYVYAFEDFLDERIDFSDLRKSLSGDNLSEFLNEKGGYFEFKSSIFAKYFLNNRVGIEQVLDLVYRVLLHLENVFQYDDFNLYKDFSKAFMQFNLYKEIYSKNSARDGRISINKNIFSEKIDVFYDKCRHLKIAKGDPLFVVQLSMAQMDRGNYSECEKLISAAEALCMPGWDQYHIETHKSEVIMKRAQREGLSKDLIEERYAFKLLKSIVQRRNERYHPFGVMDLMINVFNDNLHGLNDKDRDTVRNMLSSMTDLASRFPSEIRDRYHIVKLVNDRAERLLNRI